MYIINNISNIIGIRNGIYRHKMRFSLKMHTYSNYLKQLCAADENFSDYRLNDINSRAFGTENILATSL